MKALAKIAGLFLILVVFFGALFLFKAQFSFSNINVDAGDLSTSTEGSLFKSLPEANPKLTNILFLGIRGRESPYGGLLTDSIMVGSINKETNELSLVSIPRDLYLHLPGTRRKEKINYAYAYGLEKGGIERGFEYSKRVVSRVTGLHIDHTVVAELDSLKKIINVLGGVTIHLEEPFVEDSQWGCNSEGKNCNEFRIPAEKNTLDGETSLRYIRSRFSSSDFDRARRQQQVLKSLKKKVLSLGMFSSPKQLLELLNIVEKNVRFDLSKKELLALIHKAQKHEWQEKGIDTLVLDPDTVPIKTKIENKSYILVPENNDWAEIRKKVKNFIVN